MSKSTTTTFTTLPMIVDEQQLQTVVVDKRYSLIKRLGFGGQSEVFLAVDSSKSSAAKECENGPQLILPPITPKAKKVSFESTQELDLAGKKLVALKIFKETPAHKVKHEYKVSKDASAGNKKIVKPKKLKINASDVSVGEDLYETQMNYIAYEYLGGSSLLARLLKEEPISEEQSLDFFKQILQSVHYLHEKQGYAHQDIKPENFVFTQTGELKMVDLAFATAIDEACTVNQGSSSYMAPEINNAESKPFNTRKADIFSLGVTLFVTYFGFPPFEQAQRGKCDFFDFWCEEGAKKFFKSHPNSASMFGDKKNAKKIVKLLSTMMQEDPDKRPESVQEILEFLCWDESATPEDASTCSQ